MSFESWRKVKLGEIADVQTGPFGSQLHVSDYTATGIPVIMPVNIINEKVDTNGIARISQSTADTLAKHKVLEGDIVFSRRGDVERHAFIRNENVGWLCGTGCLKVRIKGNVESRFISYQLLTSEKKTWLRNHAVGTTMPNLNTSILSDLEIDLPEIKIQRRIAAILSSLDDKIELNRQMNQTLEAIAQALFKKWFVAFNFPGATGEMQDSELGKIPKGWEVGTIGSLFDFVIGGDWGKDNHSEEFSNYCSVIRGTDLEDILNAKIDRVPQRFIKTSNLSKRKLQEGDIVFEISGGSKDQATGRNLLITKEIIELFQNPILPASFCRLIRAKNIETAIFLGTFLNGFYADGGTWDYQLQSTGISNFQFGYFQDKKMLVVPKHEVLKKFADIIKPFYEQIGQNIKQIQTLIQLRDTLLPKLMKGEISVTETFSNAHV